MASVAPVLHEVTADSAPIAVNTFPEFDAFFDISAPAQDKGEPVQATSSPLPCATATPNDSASNAVNILPDFVVLF